ncbi:MAG: hypothetical protein V4651_04475 [Bacteroidota bacterium]
MNFFKKLFSKHEAKQPEDYFKTTITDEFVKVEHPERKTEQILWKDIIEIKFINTDTGPFAPDVLVGADRRKFRLSTSAGKCRL